VFWPPWDHARVPNSRRDAALVLWDVDHTLLSVGGVSRALYERAFQATIGRPLDRLAVMTGRTERAILTETLRLNDVEVSDALVTRFYDALGVTARELAGLMRAAGRALPGAREAVSALRDTRVVQSVVTGNLRDVARAKLDAFGLGEGLDLDVGGYGDDGSDRAVLVRQARRRAEEKYGISFAGKRTFVIGDTPHDIKGAHDAGVYAIGVATGSSPRSVLEECGADLVLSDLTRPDDLRTAILGR
jgi:phosphoglycolate phosphatase-like HAD superfamily hydrolase